MIAVGRPGNARLPPISGSDLPYTAVDRHRGGKWTIPVHTTEWTELLVGGSSGVGKSTAAARIGRQFGLPWLHVDDIRLALQWSRVSLPNPQDTAALYFFDENRLFGDSQLSSCAMD